MPQNEFVPARKWEPAAGFGVRVLQAVLALQTVFGLDWYDMLTVVSAPAGVAA